MKIIFFKKKIRPNEISLYHYVGLWGKPLCLFSMFLVSAQIITLNQYPAGEARRKLCAQDGVDGFVKIQTILFCFFFTYVIFSRISNISWYFYSLFAQYDFNKE